MQANCTVPDRSSTITVFAVGEACQEWSHLLQRPTGIYISLNDMVRGRSSSDKKPSCYPRPIAVPAIKMSLLHVSVPTCTRQAILADGFEMLALALFHQLHVRMAVLYAHVRATYVDLWEIGRRTMSGWWSSLTEKEFLGWGIWEQTALASP